MYRIFLGAPTISEIDADPASYAWQTFSSSALSSKSLYVPQATQSVALPLATLEEASHRISLIYKDIVFGEDEENLSSLHDGSENEVEASVFRGIGAFWVHYMLTPLMTLLNRANYNDNLASE